ncbi:hypothetical protein ABMA27_009023 [Loxostege sticticalis]|uniref:RNA-directed DNA polymerase n=1 Tax=Loxostege sticticalis TaxID=481309 RepID=A0ABR3HA37_LOXSC
MRHADALSRNPYTVAVVSDFHDQLRRAQLTDDGLRAIVEVLKEKPYEDYVLDNNLLYKGQQRCLVIPKTMENDILNRVHSKGHFSKRKMKELICKDYFIPNLDKKIEQFILGCIPCLLATRKSGKQEGWLNSIEKASIPMHTLHCDHIGPLCQTKKMYNYILTVVDAFTKFVWLFPTKSTTSRETIDKLLILQQTFGNPTRYITDRGTAFTSGEFKTYCDEENIQHVTITTGVPRGNGQVERIHRIMISVLTKLCILEPMAWYKHVSRVQRALNSTYQRSIDTTPFELLVGTKMKSKEDVELLDLILEEEKNCFMLERDDLRKSAKEYILKIQEENQRSYNKKRKESTKYKVGDFVAIKRTQFGGCLKLKPKYLGPYEVKNVKPNDRYDVEKVDHSAEGPCSVQEHQVVLTT